MDELDRIVREACGPLHALGANHGCHCRCAEIRAVLEQAREQDRVEIERLLDIIRREAWNDIESPYVPLDVLEQAAEYVRERHVAEVRVKELENLLVIGRTTEANLHDIIRERDARIARLVEVGSFRKCAVCGYNSNYAVCGCKSNPACKECLRWEEAKR